MMGDLARVVHDELQKHSEIHDLYTGDCRGCGACCSRFMPLSAADIQRVKDHTASHGIDPRPRLSEADLMCPYLTQEQICAIYEARPDICRAYRCDLQVKGDPTLLKLIMRHGPYQNMDMREVIEGKAVSC